MVFYYIHHIFIHSSTDRYLDCFHILVIVNDATVNSGMHISFGLVFLLSLSKYPGMGLLNHIVLLFSNFLRNLHMFYITVVPNLHFYQQCMKVLFLFSILSPTLFICCLLDNGHSYRCEVMSHCGFDLRISGD